jgi:hypothetical protein
MLSGAVWRDPNVFSESSGVQKPASFDTRPAKWLSRVLSTNEKPAAVAATEQCGSKHSTSKSAVCASMEIFS